MIFSQRNSPSSDARECVFNVSPTAAGGRLDRCLAGCLPAISRSRIQAVIRSGGVLLNGAPAKASEMVRAGDEILWRESPPMRCESAQAQEMPLEILFEDDFLAVLSKPAGMVVHPGPGHKGGTLVSGLLHHFGSLSQIGGVERPGIVHRLDKETSGCLVVAKTDSAHRSLAAQFAGQGSGQGLSGLGFRHSATAQWCRGRANLSPSRESKKDGRLRYRPRAAGGDRISRARFGGRRHPHGVPSAYGPHASDPRSPQAPRLSRSRRSALWTPR